MSSRKLFPLPALGLLISLSIAACPARPDPDTASPDAATSPSGEAIVASPLAGDPMHVTVHQLPNGMRVYISPDATLPEIHSYVVVRAGSAHEPVDSTGLAHYLEHMLFKGTDELGTLDYPREKPHLDEIARLYGELRRAAKPEARPQILAAIDAENEKAAAFAVPGDFDRLYGRLGLADLNAYTSFDETTYQVTIPANRLEQWAAVEAERFADPVFRLFLPELESVYEEKNLELDDPEDAATLALRRATFGDHPYGRSILGTTEHLKTPAYGDMVEFFERWYQPQNMAIVLAGDVSASQAVPILEKTLGAIPSQPVPDDPVPAVAPLHGRVFEKVGAPGTEEVRMNWLTVPYGHADAVAIEVLAELLNNEGTGLLTLALERPQVVPAAGASASFMGRAGHLMLWAIARNGQSLDEVERLVLAQIERLRRGDFTDQAIRSVVEHLELDETYDWENNDRRADAMLDAFVHGRPWAEVVAEPQRRRALTREELVRVANLYLGSDYAVVHKVDGQLDAPKLSKPAITAAPSHANETSAFARRLAAAAVTPLQPSFVRPDRDYQRRKLDSGGELIAADNRRNGLMQLSYRFEVGMRSRPLLCDGLELLELSDPAGRTIDELKGALFELGGIISFECGTDHAAIHVFGPDRNLEALVSLLRDWVATAHADPQRWNLLRDNTLSLRADATENPDLMALALSSYALRGETSPWRLEPSDAQLRAATASAMLEEARALLRMPRQTLYFGPRDAEAAARVIDLGPADAEPPTRAPYRYRRPERPEVFALHQDRVGANVTVLWARDPVAVQQRAAVRVLDYYLDGDSSSRVYRELRERRGLVYSSLAGFALGDRPEDDAFIQAGFAAQADKTLPTIELLLEILREPVDPQLFEVARGSVEQALRRHRVEPRSIVYEVVSWDEAGLAEDPNATVWQALPDLDTPDLETLLQTVRNRPVVVSVAGDLDRIGRKRLAEIGRLTEIPVGALVSWDDE